MQEAVIDIKKLNYHTNGRHILKDINLKIYKGEFVGLIGSNGAGKTTLLKCINGINPSEGNLKINGISLKDMKTIDVAKNVCLLHQNTSITFPFKAFGIVMMGRYPHIKPFGTETKTDFEIAEQCMVSTGTFHLKDRSVTQMSGGERQRVLYAKVLAQQAGLVLLDEPSAGLDIAFEEQLFKHASDMTQTVAETVVAAVHDLRIAARYCKRLVLMKDGLIIADGCVENVLTTSNLSKAYGVNALVYRNKITGVIDFHLYDENNDGSKAKIHVIGGGGSASGVIRHLFDRGYRVTTGVFSYGDSDLSCAEVFGIDMIVCKPFSEIDDESHKKNVEFVKDADITVLCNMPFGIQNMRNIEAAMHASKLVIVEDDDPVLRDYTDGKALKLYDELKDRAIITDSARIHEVLG